MKVWELFPELYRVVKEEHERVGLIGDGHDFWHAVRVAQCAIKIAETPEVGRLAAAAGLCHNADYILRLKNPRWWSNPAPDLITLCVQNWLQQEPRIRDEEYLQIADAVVLHDRQNKYQVGKPVVITLADADRVVNLEADVIIRCGQYYSNLPAVDPVHWLDDPEATYRKPKSVLRDIAYALDWVERGGPVSIRLPKAWGPAISRATFLRSYLETVRRQWKEAGFLPP